MKNTGLAHPQDIILYPDTVQQAVLVANTAQAFDVPTGASYVSFGANTDFFVKFGSTGASVPTTSSTGSSTNAELNPTSRNIGSTADTTGYSLIAAAAGIVTASWYTR